ncbi:hypothetical protein BDN70DRAFT_955268 [Pholiota conissans]|uniref:Uncharacterized protein n=1 Tax=Pholiota conissans TaxID=109636 RepID=A0A9P5YXD2_9AGAR|nr:hypothetical protein BDN70DRAFT_955268 [Pholiota conissans]
MEYTFGDFTNTSPVGTTTNQPNTASTSTNKRKITTGSTTPDDAERPQKRQKGEGQAPPSLEGKEKKIDHQPANRCILSGSAIPGQWRIIQAGPEFANYNDAPEILNQWRIIKTPAQYEQWLEHEHN